MAANGKESTSACIGNLYWIQLFWDVMLSNWANHINTYCSI